MTTKPWTCYACKSVQVDGESVCANEDCPSHERYECAECGQTDHPTSECPTLRLFHPITAPDSMTAEVHFYREPRFATVARKLLQPED